MRSSGAVALQRRRQRETVPQIVVGPVDGGFGVSIAGQPVRLCGDELDAHHWGKHAFEAVHQGLRRPGEIERAMCRLCLAATRYNLHS